MSLVEMRTYLLKPEYSARDYFDIYEGEVQALQVERLGSLKGYFATEVGALNAIVSLWSYPDFETRQTRRAALAREPAWQTFLDKVRPMLRSMENCLLTPAPFTPNW
jgi:hypothetical protein